MGPAATAAPSTIKRGGSVGKRDMVPCACRQRPIVSQLCLASCPDRNRRQQLTAIIPNIPRVRRARTIRLGEQHSQPAKALEFHPALERHAGRAKRRAIRDGHILIDSVERKACPTSPEPKDAPFISRPLFRPARSLALPSAGHQLISPDGAGSQGVTVRTALELLVAPNVLVTRTL